MRLLRTDLLHAGHAICRALMLGDSAKIQVEDEDYLNRNRQRSEGKIEPIYDLRDVFRTLTRLQGVP